MAELSHMVGRNGTEVPKAAKYPIDHKMFHHGAAVSGLVAIVTGIFMMLRLDTWLGAANPYVLNITDNSWGVVYVVHGISGVVLFGMIITHIYFAIRPDKWWITKSMIYGFISREKYVETFDPGRWPVSGAAPQEELVPAGVGAPAVAGEADEGGGLDEGGFGGGGGGGGGEEATDDGDAPGGDDERASEVGGLD